MNKSNPLTVLFRDDHRITHSGFNKVWYRNVWKHLQEDGTYKDVEFGVDVFVYDNDYEADQIGEHGLILRKKEGE